MARKTVSTRASAKNVINIHVGDVGKKRAKRRARSSKKSDEEGQFVNIMRSMAQRQFVPTTSQTSIRLEAPNLGRMVSVPEPLRADVYGAVPAVVNPIGVSRPSNGSAPDLQPNPRPNIHEAANPNDVRPRNPSVLLMPSSPAPSPMARPSYASVVASPRPSSSSSSSAAASSSSSSSAAASSSADADRQQRALENFRRGSSTSSGPTNPQIRELLLAHGIPIRGRQDKNDLMQALRLHGATIFSPDDPEYDQYQ